MGKINDPTKAPLIIFSVMIIMSIVTVAIVLVTHSKRKTPYMQSRPILISNRTQQILLINYDDFGPQAMSYLTIGKEWWQWQSTGSSNPRKKYDIKVIVYRGLEKTEVAKRFPISISKELDYRYLSYNSALDYLDAQIEENGRTSRLSKKLTMTRSKILNHFGD